MKPPLCAIGLGFALFVASYALPNVGPLDRGKKADIAIYQRYGSEILDGRVPYRDFFVLYPPGALPLFTLPAIGNDSGYAARFKVVEWALGLAMITAVVAGLAAIQSPPARLFGAAALVGIAPAALGESFVATYDLWPACLTAVAMAAFLVARDRLGFAGLGAATAAKVYPAVLVPAAFLFTRERVGTRKALIGTGIFGAVLVAIVLPFAILSPGGLRFSFSIQERRGLHIESLAAGFLLAANQLGIYQATVDEYLDSQNLGGELPYRLAQASTALQLVLVVVVSIVIARRRRDAQTLLLGSATLVAAVVAFGKVVSHQYLIWLLPLVALIVSRRTLPAAGMFVAALVLTQLWYPSRHYRLVRELDPVASWLIVARNLVLVGLFVYLFMLLRAQPRLNHGEPRGMGDRGFEPRTSALSERRSNRLS
jgi:Glycosyltransferase family 87